MRPLLFLTSRSIVNGFKRAVTTPRRLFSILLFAGYYYWLFIMPRGDMSMPGSLPAPPLEMLNAISFAIFIFLSLMLMLSMLSPMGGFRPADVDVLFATPVSPRVVLVFRILRDFLAAVMVPFLIIILAFRPASMGWQFLFKNMPHPEASGIAMAGMVFAWIAMAIGWVAVSYAVTLFTNRSDLRSDVNRRILTWSFIAGVVTLVFSLVTQFRGASSPQEVLAIADSPVLRTVFFTATFSSQVLMAPLTGDWALGIVGLLGLIGFAAVGFVLALIQSEWMYDQAAAKGFGSTTMRQLQQKGDVYAMAANMAREGKLKKGRLEWVSRLRVSGAWTLVWKDVFLQFRGMKFMVLLMMAIALFMNLMPVLIPDDRSGEPAPGFVVLLLQVLTAFIVTLTFAQTGFLEFLRRVDLQKPLPFSPGATVFMEMLSKAALGTAASWFTVLVLLVVKPEYWQWCLAAAIAVPAIALLISAAALMLTLMFPDNDDPSQRTLRGLLQLLAMIIFSVPGALLAIGGFALKLSPILIMLPVAAVNIAVAVLVATLSGSLYANYNPSE